MISEQDRIDYESFLQGDRVGFERLVVRYRDPLVAFIYRYIKDLYMAQDIAQDVFVELYIHKDRFDMNYNFKTYLFTIGRNKAVDYIRKNKKYMFVEHVGDYQEPMKELEEIIIQNEQKQRILSIIGQLKSDYQAAITLIDFEQLSYQEAAHVMNKSLGQMKVLIHRARKSLAKRMEREGYGNGTLE